MKKSLLTSGRHLFNNTKERVLSGDTPAGALHLGHLVGTLNNRLHLQHQHDCYYMIANTHALSSQRYTPEDIQANTFEVMLDYLSVGLDPQRSALFLESDVPEIYELATYLSMFIRKNQLERNPTLKQELNRHNQTSGPSFGFFFYPILQTADILAFQATQVPVGQDQCPHLELTANVAKTMNKRCGTQFPIPSPLLGQHQRLPGISRPDASGRVAKMSKSLNNAIFLKDSPDATRKKVRKIYTGDGRTSRKNIGRIDNNPLWAFMRAFTPENTDLAEHQHRYMSGTLSDLQCKILLSEWIIECLKPIQQRRLALEQQPNEVWGLFHEGGKKARHVAASTVNTVKEALKFSTPDTRFDCRHKQ